MDKRLDQVVLLFEEAVVRLLNAKGMMKYRKDFVDKLHRVLEDKKEVEITSTEVQVQTTPESTSDEAMSDLQDKNPIQLRAIARSMGIEVKNTMGKTVLLELLSKYEK